MHILSRNTHTASTNVLRAIILCALILMVFARPQAVKACSCIMPGTPSDELAQADGVFTGRVMAIIDRGGSLLSILIPFLDQMNINRRLIYDTLYGNSVTFAVHDSWKGVTTTTVQVETGYGGGDCGYDFAIGNEYLVYVHGTPGDWDADSCSRTDHISGAGSDLAYLNTLPTIALTPSLPTIPASLILLFCVLSAVVAGIILFRHVRRKRSTTQPGIGEVDPQ